MFETPWAFLSDSRLAKESEIGRESRRARKFERWLAEQRSENPMEGRSSQPWDIRFERMSAIQLGSPQVVGCRSPSAQETRMQAAFPSESMWA